MTNANKAQQRTLMFVHVPKTAGTTMRVIVEQQYAGQPLYMIQHDIQAERGRLARIPEADRRGLRAVFGHMEWGWHELLPEGQPYAYTTMLREPMERVLSLYAHCLLPQHYLGRASKGMDIGRFLTSGVSLTADNGMVRQLCGRDRFLQEPYHDMMIPRGGLTADDLEAAKRNLEACAVVGVSERFDDYLATCRGVLGWRVTAYRNENVTIWPRVSRYELSKEQRAAIDAATEMDRELYEHALKIVEAQ